MDHIIRSISSKIEFNCASYLYKPYKAKQMRSFEQRKGGKNVNDINHLFIGLEYDEPADICDGDMKLLDKAVKRFKLKVWENQL